MALSENKREFTFIWKIENYSMLPHQNGEALKSPEFEVDMWEGIKWHLELYPRGEDDENTEYLACYLHASVTEKKDFKGSFSLTLESTDPDEEMTETMAFSIQDLDQNFGWCEFYSFTDIYEMKNLYLPHDVFSLRCHLTPMDSGFEKLTVNNKIERATIFLKTVHVSRTSLRVQQRIFTWPIQNISTCRKRVETTFMMKDLPGLKVTLNFCEITNNVHIPIEIQQTASAPLDEKQERLFVKCKITVVNVVKSNHDSKESSYLFEFALNDVWHFPLFIKTINLTRGKYLNQRDTLFLQCEFAFSYKNEVFHFDEKPFGIESTKQAEPETSSWCTSLRNIFASGKFGDVQLRAGGETFPTHKLVLCARSSVFSAMFENNMKEMISGVVEIDDVDPSILKRMLTFINFDDITEKDLCIEDVCKLYTAADKYNVVSLKGWCTKSLMSSLSVDSVYDILFLADAHQDKFLMTMACNFIRCHETEIFDTADWESLVDSNPKLSTKVMHQVFVNKKRI